MPSRVVAPMTVKRGSVSGMDVAPGPLPTMTSTRKSSMAMYSSSSAARGQTVDLVDEQHLPGIQGAEDRGQVARMLDGGAGGHPDRHRKLVGHDHGQRGLAQTRRTGQQDVVRRDLAFAGGVQEQLAAGPSAVAAR